MKLHSRQTWAILTALSTMLTFLNPRVVFAQEHVLPLSELHRQLQSSAGQRARNLADLQRVLSLPPAQDALKKANANPGQIQKAIAQLNDEEVARLADRARAAEKDVEGGFIVGILALIGLVVVILVVLAVVD